MLSVWFLTWGGGSITQTHALSSWFCHPLEPFQFNERLPSCIQQDFSDMWLYYHLQQQVFHSWFVYQRQWLSKTTTCCSIQSSFVSILFVSWCEKVPYFFSMMIISSCSYKQITFIFVIIVSQTCFHLQVMRDPNGISRGSGFVAFSTPEEASRAVSWYVFCAFMKALEYTNIILLFW
jgi:hypothetical protein